MIRIAKFANGKNMQLIYNQVPAELLWKLLQVCLLFLNPRKLLCFANFLLSGPLYAILREKANFTDRHVHVFIIFVNKLIQLYCI